MSKLTHNLLYKMLLLNNRHQLLLKLINQFSKCTLEVSSQALNAEAT